VPLLVTGRKAQVGMWMLAAASADCTADDKLPIVVPICVVVVAASIRRVEVVEAEMKLVVELVEQGEE
jgi:hypothetical protein